MLQFAIVEDEKNHAKLLEQMIRKWARSAGQEVEIRIFSSGDSFLFSWEENRCLSALFLDIQMEGIDGVALARRIREEDEDLAIVFTTGITDYMQTGYDLAALHYLIKPLSEEKVSACLDRIGKKEKQEPYLLLSVLEDGEENAKSIRLLTDEIYYMEAFAHYTEIHVRGHVYRVREGIGRLAESLPDRGFVNCHRSYLVNLSCVLRVEKSDLVLESGEKLPVSRRRWKAVNEAFIEYYSRRKEWEL